MMGSVGTVSPPSQSLRVFLAQSVPRLQRHLGHKSPPILGRHPRDSPFSKQGPCPGAPPLPPCLNKIGKFQATPQNAWSRVSGAAHLSGSSPAHRQCAASPSSSGPPGSRIHAVGVGVAAPQGPSAALSVCSVCGDGGFVCGTWGEGGKHAMWRLLRV